ncbi:MAG: glycosyltransferase family 4 protein [Pseudomonadota bacterium]
MQTPTGGYGYARAVIAEAAGALTHLALPKGLGPNPDDALVSETLAALATVTADRALIIDGLALGTLPAGGLRGLDPPLVGLVHHPLALEYGLEDTDRDWLTSNERQALAQCAHVITTSHTTARTLIADYHVPALRLTVAAPGTPRPGNPPAPPTVEDAQRETPGETRHGASLRLLSVAAVVPRKGFDTLIDALAMVEGDWHLTVIGSELRDPAHVATVKARATERGIAARITWAGAVDHGAVAAAMASHDLFVLASRHEGYGMAYTEAMAAGMAVIGCASGAVDEATCGGAFLVPPDDPARLAGAISDLLSRPERRADYAAKACAAAATLPDWPDTWARIDAALAQIRTAGQR